MTLILDGISAFPKRNLIDSELEHLRISISDLLEQECI